jgi:hypothetical protein
MKHLKLLLLGFFFILILPQNLFSQAPDGVNYQAVVRGPLGLPLNAQPVDVRFNIRQGSPTGTSVFLEIHNTTTNQFGLINLELGSVNNGAFSVINWGTGGAYYLQIEVDAGSGFDDLGASQLLSVPYALFAKSAATGQQGFNSLLDTVTAGASCPNGGYKVLLGLDANANTVLDPVEVTSSFYVCNGTSGLSINWIGSSTTFPVGNPNDAFYNSADGISYIFNGTTTSWDTLVAGGSGTPDNDWIVAGNNMSSGILGNVGIGTLTPSKKLSIQSAAVGGDGIQINNTSGGNPGVEYQTQGTTRYVMGIDQSDNNKFKIGTSTLFTNTRLTINGQGNVGIGTNTPVHNLTVGSTDSIISSFTSTNPDVAVISVLGTNPNAFVGSIFLTGSDSGIVGIDPLKKIFHMSNTTPGGHTIIVGDSSASMIGINTLSIASKLIYNKSPSIYNESDTVFNYSTSGPNFNYNRGIFKTDSLYLLGGNLTTGYVLAHEGNGKAVWTDPATLPGAAWNSNGTKTILNNINDYVGIGISTPLVKLHIVDSVQTIMAVQSSNSIAADKSSNVSFLRSRGSSATPTAVLGGDRLGKLEFLGWDGTFWSESASIRAIADEPFTSSGNGTHIEFQTTAIGTIINKEAMRITDNGYVGIGTVSPTEILHIKNNLSTYVLNETSGGHSFFVADGTNNLGLRMSNAGVDLANVYYDQLTSTLNFWVSGNRMHITNAGNVGIGTISPSALTHINMVSPALTALKVTNGNATANNAVVVQFDANSTLTNAFRLERDGQIGLGTASPAAKLDVIGNVKITDGTEGVGNVLVSDATGTATWKPNAIGFESSIQNPYTVPPGLITGVLPVTFDTVIFNDGGAFDPNLGSYHFRPTVSGVYAIEATILVNHIVGNPNEQVRMAFVKNSTLPEIKTAQIYINPGEIKTITISTTMRLNAGDAIHIELGCAAGNTLIVIPSEAVWFSGHLVYSD